MDASANSRRESWAAAWRIAEDNPVFGVGIRNSELMSYAYGADMQGRTIHSQYLQTAADSGFVALGLYIVVLVSFWFSTRTARLATTRRYDPDGSRGLRSGVRRRGGDDRVLRRRVRSFPWRISSCRT